MSKKRRQRSYSKPLKYDNREPTSSENIVHPDATLGPDASLDQPSTVTWIERDSTNAPKIGKESEPEKPYAESQWALADKYIFGRRLLPFALVVIVIGWIIIQDNGAGKLTDWSSIWWTVQKCGVILGIFSLILFVQWLYSKIFD